MTRTSTRTHIHTLRTARAAVVLATVPVALLLVGGSASASGLSGDASKPQPLSQADQNGHGANPGTTAGCGAYCSTRDGSASQNGKGGGDATGKPCAGCVGKADNKNPQGQAPSGPADHNAGYECDRNQGIGKGNPAHTACTPGTTTGGTTGSTPVTPPAVTPPVVTPPAVTPPAATPPVVTPPVCTTDASMPAGAESSCTPGTGTGTGTGTGNGNSSGVPGTATPGTPAPGTVMPAVPSVPAVDSGSGAGTVVVDQGSTPTTVVVPTATSVRSNGGGTLTLGGGAVTADGRTALPFTGDSTGELALVAMVLLTAGGGLVLGGRRA